MRSKIVIIHCAPIPFKIFLLFKSCKGHQNVTAVGYGGVPAGVVATIAGVTKVHEGE